MVLPGSGSVDIPLYLEPELDLGGLDLEPRRMHLPRRQVVPVPGPIALLAAVDGQEKLTLGDDAAVLRLVGVRLDDGARWVGREEHLTAVGGEAKRVERPVEGRKIPNPIREVLPRHREL
jgi:hypothetical protein